MATVKERMTPKILAALALLQLLCCCGVQGQSNYASHANDVNYIGEGLPEQATLDGKVTRLDDLSSVIFLNRTKGTLNCGAGSMQVDLKFNEPFFGIAYADFDRNSACQIAGKGALTYSLELPLKGCGTKQDPQRVFTNNVVVRFHPGLEMDGDEIITIVCRYPPPLAPPPAVPAPIMQENLPPSAAVEPPLKGFHILLVICAILFLSLLLLGLGCSYVCLKKRRHVTLVRRHPFSSAGTGSEITKLSGSSLGNLSMFEGLKIPRAHAPPAAASSGSEAALILEHSDTLPSDYPSESPSSAHSEVEDVDTRSLRRPSTVSSAGSYDNKGFVQETIVASVPPPPPEPKFDVSVRVKRAPPPPPMVPSAMSTTSSHSDIESTMSTQARNLTSVLEQREDHRATTFTYVPELHPPPAKYVATPPVYSRIMRRQQVETRSMSDNDNWSQGEMDMVDSAPPPPLMQRRRSLTSLNTEMTDTRSMSEIVDTSHATIAVEPPPPPPPPPIAPPHLASEIRLVEDTTEMLEPPVVVSRRPEITSHVVDDVFLRTITEKRTIEDVERYRRQVTEYHSKPAPPPPPPQWDVAIRHYPAPGGPDHATQDNDPGPDWESFSEASSVGYPAATVNETHHTQESIQRSYLSTLEVPPQNPPIPNWDVLIRAVNPPPTFVAPEHHTSDFFREEALLTIEDRQKWREIITTESTLRTLLTEATVREDYERIRKDQRFEKLFEPKKWDVIIRVLAPPSSDRPTYDQRGGPINPRYRRKAPTTGPSQDWDTRSRRSSLPTLYEYDSDDASSVRTLVPDLLAGPAGAGSVSVPPPPARSRRTSRSSLRSDMDVRSMTEVTVDFARADAAETLSDASSYYRGGSRRFYDDDELLRRGSDDEDGPGGPGGYAGSLVRSVSQPSLARSASEFTEHWVAPSGARRYWGAGDSINGEMSSPEHSPRSQRSRTSTALTSVSQRHPLPGDEIVFSRTTTTMRESFQQQTTQGWFGDADSEASYK